MRMGFPFLLPLLLLSGAAHSAAQVTLPLGGYYRPGQFMPFRAAEPVKISGDGVIPTDAAGGGAVSAVLVARPVERLLINEEPLEATLHPLPDGVRLIGEASARPSAAQANAVTVVLDPLDPVPGPAVAWEALDELQLDAAAATRMGEVKLMELLASGVAIRVAGDAQPALSLSWERDGDGWVARPMPAGPRGSVFGPALLPVAGWAPGVPEPARRGTVLVAALFAILATGLAMWRAKYAAPIMAALIVLSLGGIHLWIERQPAVSVAGGTIMVESADFTQADRWTYHYSTREQVLHLPAGTRVMAASPQRLLELHPAGDKYRIRSGGRVALLSRSLIPRDQESPLGSTLDSDVASPLLPLVKAGYLRPGVSIVAQTPADPWPTLRLRANKP